MRQLFLTLLLVSVAVTGMAQAVITPRNMALGGGGSTYITDANANFYNPANLLIQDRKGDFSVTVGSGGFLVDALQNYPYYKDQVDNFRHYIDLYDNEPIPLADSERPGFIIDNYISNRTLTDNRARYDLTLLGLKWKQAERSYSLALRTRTSSSFKVGKGWYDSGFTETDDGRQLHDRSLIHRYQSLYEISFGYAESFKFLTGLTPKLDNFIIGIAPKFVMGGDYQNAEWTNHYLEDAEGKPYRHIQSFSYDASGDFGNSTSAYLGGISLDAANTQAFNNDILNINGYGAGLDIGITYMLTLGDDLSAIRSGEEPTQRSVRFSFSMTDIGFMAYSGEEVSLTSGPDTTTVSTLPNRRADEIFTGARGQYAGFIEKFGDQNPFNSAQRSTENFSTLLPMALHGGALLEINRLKLMGDISIGLTNNAFNSTKLVSAIGVELRPLTFLPLRGGLRFKAQDIDFISMGTAIETKWWELSVAAQLHHSSLTEQPTIAGVSVATLQFHF